MMGSSESAEDLVQQTFLLALFQGEALRAHPCPEGWLMKALHNLAINERRRTARRQEIPLEMCIRDSHIIGQHFILPDLVW